MNKIKAAIQQVLRGPAVSHFLKSLGVDPRRYWILMDLFSTLSPRQEMSGQGNFGMGMKFGAGFWLLVSSVASLTALFDPPAKVYLSIFLFATGLVLSLVLFFETAGILINPTEGLVLAHLPINGATYTAAKLSHLLRVLIYFGLAPNLLPALMGSIGLKDARWFYFANHLVGIAAVSIGVAVAWCTFFGLIIRFVPPGSLKGVLRKILLAPAVLLVVLRVIQAGSIFNRAASRRGSPVLRTLGSLVSPLVQWPAQFFLVGHPMPRESHPFITFGILGAVVAMGMIAVRTLSVDYLIRVHSMVRGGSRVGTRQRRSPIGAAVSLLSGGQNGRAGFEYVRRMMLREFIFVQRVVRLLPILIGGVILLITGPSPFSGRFSPIQLAPHVLGFSFFMVSYLLPYGSESKAMWIFLLVPAKSFRPFVRGVYLAFWLPFVLLPHLIGFVYHAWLWGVADSVAFLAFSITITSMYLGIELKRIDGIPFSRPAKASSGEMEIFFLLIVRLAVVGVAVGIQHFLLFRSPATLLIATLFVGAGAYLWIQQSLGTLETAVRHQLNGLSAGSTLLYSEIE